MPRDINITKSTMAHLAEGGELYRSESELAIVGKLVVEKDGSFTVDSRWHPKNVPDDGKCEVCFGDGRLADRYVDANGHTLSLHSDSRCYVCDGREMKATVLPPKYQFVDYGKLQPHDKIETPNATQQKLIDQIAEGELDWHSVLFSGPSRAGKTTLACALLHRMMELYCAGGWTEMYPNFSPPIYRVNCDRWLGEHLAHETHDFSSETKRPSAPQPNVKTLTSVRDTEGIRDYDYHPSWRPVLLLEEIDKFSPSKFKVDALFTLLNSCFERGGMIISTTNLSERELKERFPDWFYRRLVESSQDEMIRHRDLFKVVKQKK